MAGGVFRKGLSEAFLAALDALAQRSGWWADVLADRNLLIAVRDESINVYWQGQSLFRVGFVAGAVTATTHPKYLIDPSLAGQVPLIGDTFAVGEVLASKIITRYEGRPTLEAMKRSAKLYAGAEKEGVHAIVGRSASVIDVEVALSTSTMDSAADDIDKLGKLPRIDIAAFEHRSDHVELVFWEAKLFGNKDLRAKSGEAPVVGQIAKYRATLDHHRNDLVTSYERVARDMVRIANMSVGRRSVSQVVMSVASGAELRLAQEPSVGLLVFDFDAAQRDGTNWKEHLAKLEDSFGSGRVKAAGSADNLRI